MLLELDLSGFAVEQSSAVGTRLIRLRCRRVVLLELDFGFAVEWDCYRNWTYDVLL